MALEITVHREPYVGNLHVVDLYLPDGTVRGRLLEPGRIRGLIQRVREDTGVCFVHFVGRGRPARTFTVRRNPQKRVIHR